MKFINVHILQVVPLSNLNRDDAGSPKSVVYGGAQRSRISSQALKRAARTSFEAGSSSDMTSRSKLASRRLQDIVTEMLDVTGAELTADQLSTLRKDADKEVSALVSAKEKKDEGGEGQVGTDTLVWLAERELSDLAVKLIAKASDRELVISDWITDRTSSLTIAAFGRMFAAAPSVQTEAALQMAHAFTTHEASVEIDYFTAADDLRAQYAGDSGAGHLDLAELTSGVYYRYLNIDRSQLRRTWVDMDSDDAAKRLTDFVLSLILTLPTGKQNSTAPHTIPYLVVIQESSQPVSFADAFESPIRSNGEGFATLSAEALSKYIDRAEATAPDLFGQKWVVDLASADSPVTLAEAVANTVGWLIGVE